MGNEFGKTFQDSMKEQKACVKEAQDVMFERQIELQDQVRKRNVALQIGRAQDIFNWFGSFYAVSAVTCLLRSRCNPGALIPLVPLTFILGYQYDIAYGNKMVRIKDYAGEILHNEPHKLEMPHGMPTLKDIDEGIEFKRDLDCEKLKCC